MKVRLVLDVDDHARYVISKYFAPASQGLDSLRTRATRTQVVRFARAALRTAVRQQAEELQGRSRATERRLQRGHEVAEQLRPPKEEQRSLTW